MKTVFQFMVILTIFVISLSAQNVPTPTMLDETTNSGKAIVEPNRGIAATYGTWIVKYTVGEDGLATGGGIRVELPDVWHAGPRNSAVRLQATNSQAENYVQATASRPGVKLKTIVESQSNNVLIKHAKQSLDGRLERYVFVVRVLIEEGTLKENDTISVVYGDQSEGSIGYRAAAIAVDDLPVFVAVDSNGDSGFKMLESLPSITSLPNTAVAMQIHAKSQAVVGKPHRVLVSLIDQEGNPVQHDSIIRLDYDTDVAKGPNEVTINNKKGYASFEITPQQKGLLRIKGRTRGMELSASSNPIEIADKEPEHKIYWGDLHSHTHFSWDGVGYDQFNYARYISALDFYAMTDHSIVSEPNGLTRGLNRGVYDQYTKLTDQFHEPGEFVTLHAYEASFGRPYGHHNVFFRGAPGPLLYPQKDTLQQFWKTLAGGNALTIPHHTGKFPSGVDYSIHNAEMRRNFEIYSAHGLSEVYNPDHPLAFEQSLFTSDSRSLKSPTYIQDTWKRGLKLSTVAASDDHNAQPGQSHYGITAVYAPELTRDAIFQALYERYTYGTTGAKIILDFQCNGVRMGNTVKGLSNPEFHIKAIGTDTIAWIELLRYIPGEDNSFVVIQSWKPNNDEITIRATDNDFQPGAIYYVRLQQRYKINGRVAMAWSSPIWTE